MNRLSPGCGVANAPSRLSVAVRANTATWAPDYASTLKTAFTAEMIEFVDLFIR